MKENYLVDRQDLARFVDELIKKKPLPVDTTEELEDFRARTIDSLDDSIGLAIFGQLDDEQDAELNHLLDDKHSTEDDYEQFFTKIGLNVDQTVQDTMTAFASAFLAEGGNYA